MRHRATWAAAGAGFFVGLVLGTCGVVYDVLAIWYRKHPFVL